VPHFGVEEPELELGPELAPELGALEVPEELLDPPLSLLAGATGVPDVEELLSPPPFLGEDE
jgi:hypothetical protein